MTDRRELKRQYRETARPMGVYRVRAVGIGTSFVGTSVDVAAMLNRQRFQLETGMHPDRELQADWDRIGADGFSFEMLDTLEPLDEPGWDPADDLETLAAIWRQRLVDEGESLYGTAPTSP